MSITRKAAVSPPELHRVSLVPDSRGFDIRHGERLLAAAWKSGVGIKSICGGRGKCGSCIVQIEAAESGTLSPLSELERELLPAHPQGGTYRGLAAVTAHVSKGRGTWAEGSCEPERFIVAGDRVIVLAHVRVRLKHETEWREGRTADVYTFRDGKAIQFYTFFDERQAFEWAGVRWAGVRASDAI